MKPYVYYKNGKWRCRRKKEAQLVDCLDLESWGNTAEEAYNNYVNGHIHCGIDIYKMERYS